MGAGRKKTTLPLKEKPQPSCTVNCSTPARNLGKTDLAAVIFGCKHHTIRECLSKLLFGLPSPHFAYVKNISPGLPLFLFNYSDRKLYGIFQAANCGRMDINPYAWTGEGAEYSPYPAQVQVRIQTQCQPLLEDQFRPIIADNYYEQRLFWFELDRIQTRNLISLFLLSPVDTSLSRPKNMPTCNTLANCLPASGRRHAVNQVEAPFPEAVSERVLPPNTNSLVIGNANNSGQQKTWSSLFQNSATSQTMKKDQDLGAQAPQPNLPYSDQSNMEGDALSVPPRLKGEILNYEALPEDAAMWTYEEVPVGSESGWGLSCSVVQRRTDFEEKEGEQVTSYDLPHFEESNINWDSSHATPLLEGESWPSEGTAADDVTKVHEGEVLNHENGSPYPFATDDENLEDGCPTEAQEVKEMNSSSIQSVLAKLMQDIGGLKVSQLKQVQKIICLEQELVESKAEIQQLKNRCNLLESGSLPQTGHV